MSGPGVPAQSNQASAGGSVYAVQGGDLYVGVAPPAPQRPWMAPPLDREAVDRPALIERLVAALGTGDTVVGLVGTGGFGKTTLAKQVCGHPGTAASFTGGLLWTTVGEAATGPDVATRLNDLCAQLTGVRPGLSDPEQAGFRFARVLDAHPGPVLLVVDDVWTEEQLSPFLLGGSRCRRLVTTRNQGLIPAAATTVRVDRMRPDEARALLTRGVADLGTATVDELLRRTGGWPVLLDLTNRALHRAARNAARAGRTADDAGRRIAGQLAVAGPGALDPTDARQRRRAVAATVEVSLDLLPATARDRYVELAVFAEDTDIPVATLGLLWEPTGGLDDIAVERLCEELFDLSLVLGYRDEPPAVRLHDVLRDYLRHLAGSERLAALTGALLDRAGALLTGPGSWWTLPPTQGYLRDHLAFHLAEAGRDGELAALVTDLRWIVARLATGGPAGIEADLARVDTPAAAALGRGIARAAHLLAPLDPPEALGAVLVSRLEDAPLDRSHLGRPYLANRWPLPDQPHPALRRAVGGHTAAVTAVAVAPDGSWVVTCADDGSVRMFDPVSGLPRGQLVGHTDRVSAVAVGADRLATGSDDGTVRVWSPSSGRVRAVLTGHTDAVTGVALAPDGAWLASVARDRTGRVWDTATGAAVRVIELVNTADAVAVDPAGRFVVTAGIDRAVRLWDVATGAIARILSGHDATVNAVAVSRDGASVASASDDGTARVWDAATGEPRAVLRGHGSGVDAVAFTVDGRVVTGSGDRTVRIWDLDGGHRTLSGHTSAVTAVAAGPDGTWLVTGSADRTVRIWDTGAAAATSTPAGAQAVAVGPDGSWVALGFGQRVVLWDATTRETLRTLAGHSLGVSAIAVAPDGAWLATASGDRTARLWDVHSGRIRAVLEGHTDWVSAVVVAPSWIATGSDDATVRRWATDGRPLEVLGGHSSAVTGLAAGPGGAWLASSSRDGTVRIWDLDGGHRVLAGHTDFVWTVTASPDGTWLASGGATRDRTVRIWDTATGEPRAVLTGHASGVTHVAASPDGRWLASTGDDGTVRIWDPASGRPATAMRVDGAVHRCAWLPTGDGVCAIGAGGTYLFGLTREEWPGQPTMVTSVRR
ncbi:NB-ARC domain-containing protein [Virgisporangium ochraceum]|uniref:NB-ARC domain-containing protein n=1 Tax=Virgisporangium ochraceum TaxID=65505 RepID=UPI001945B153|nr:NB-ARC domain-containing protein [Virgisporangium ochraceum]